MEDLMRRSTMILSVAIVLVMAVAAPASANSSTRPFKGSVTGAVTFNPVGLEVCPASGTYFGGLRTDSMANGNASHLGKVAMMSSHCTPAGDTIAGGGMTLVAANGDELYLQYEGTAPFPDESTVVIVAMLDFAITGGTGRFANASGSGDLIAYVDFEGFEDPSWAARWVWSGAIAY